VLKGAGKWKQNEVLHMNRLRKLFGPPRFVEEEEVVVLEPQALVKPRPRGRRRAAEQHQEDEVREEDRIEPETRLEASSRRTGRPRKTTTTIDEVEEDDIGETQVENQSNGEVNRINPSQKEEVTTPDAEE
jgi:hypothetical protein